MRRIQLHCSPVLGTAQAAHFRSPAANRRLAPWADATKPPVLIQRPLDRSTTRSGNLDAVHFQSWSPCCRQALVPEPGLPCVEVLLEPSRGWNCSATSSPPVPLQRNP